MVDPIFSQPPKGARILNPEDEELEQVVPTSPADNLHANPLRKHFRTPELAVSLPSGLYYYKNNEVQPNVSGELDIYSMTAGDELVLKNPDALLSGRSIELIVQSCVPQVNDVRSLMSVDVDVLLLAIRAASYGSMMEIEATCPKCTTENAFNINLDVVLNSKQHLNPPFIVELGPALSANIRPYTFAEQSKAASAAFEQGKKTQQIMSKVNDNLSSEEEEAIRAEIAKTMEYLTDLKFHLMANAILEIKSGKELVTEKEYIVEFIENAPKRLVGKILNAVEELNKFSSILRSLPVTCSNEKCKNKWTAEITFNPSSFFV